MFLYFFVLLCCFFFNFFFVFVFVRAVRVRAHLPVCKHVCLLSARVCSCVLWTCACGVDVVFCIFCFVVLVFLFILFYFCFRSHCTCAFVVRTSTPACVRPGGVRARLLALCPRTCVSYNRTCGVDIVFFYFVVLLFCFVFFIFILFYFLFFYFVFVRAVRVRCAYEHTCLCASMSACSLPACVRA